MKDVSRRDFIRYLGVGAAGLAIRPGRALGSYLGPESFEPSDVVQCYSEDAVDNSGNINQGVAQAMMDASITTLTGIGGVGEAWKSLFPGITSDTVISIKVNCASRYCPSTPESVETIVNGLVRMDIGGTSFKRNDVIVWERFDVELTRAGFTLYDGSDPDTVRCFGTDHAGVGYDYTTTLNCSGVNVNPSKIMSQMCDHLINLSVLKDHSIARVTLGLKNHYGSVYDVYAMHGGNCSPYIPALNAQIRDVLTPPDKQRIFIIDGLLGIYNGGPGGTPNFIPELYIMSRDPVACDFQGQNVINKERRDRGRQELDAEHIHTAAGEPYNLGTTDINLIEITPTGVAEPRQGVPGNGVLTVSPNPFRRSTTVAFTLPSASTVRLDLVDGSGRVRAGIFNGRLEPGGHRFRLDHGRNLAAGVYTLRLRDGHGTRSSKVTILN